MRDRLNAVERAGGWGALRKTEVREAAIALQVPVTARRACLAQASHVGLRERHALRRR